MDKDNLDFLFAKTQVKIERVVGWEHALDAARFTKGLPSLYGDNDLLKYPSDDFIRRSILAEHSHIKVVQYKVAIYNLEQWVGVHLLRHAYMIPFVSTQRSDMNTLAHNVTNQIFTELLNIIKEEEPDYNPRNLLPQGTKNNHLFWLNAQTFINISKRRMCNTASKETRAVWSMVIDELGKIDPILKEFCVRTCVYRGLCPEMKCCGYIKTKQYANERKQYENQSKAIVHD